MEDQEAAAALSGRPPSPPERQDFWRALGLETTAEGIPMLKPDNADQVYEVDIRPGEVFVDPEGNLRRKRLDANPGG